ncbi:bifunctional alpha,alpha-trehalose-phosphate synthase (UDP-forming)/trehalose-phosphatase [Nakamurella endophytica]|uniref:Bifunctional alpha,alpha-trehalose-phosphate synthase (UDP-forming)/trehalose-phosphatase n=1 Tax=Nakamurella endophytica TaxID=1748367 RepID=A0A917T965_9ACTN|nr:bifunctional alpha,alpha-trehalose-phosphate synthase (UDP-forming)/trehalose-phosphatase [Nakamurella endophytica]GGM15101.1 bifunctional alpha,alpha-trehalose-phosphate synthase (UDP-forming)/trehalose-phosphatase [Nakamurella endophytica]
MSPGSAPEATVPSDVERDDPEGREDDAAAAADTPAEPRSDDGADPDDDADPDADPDPDPDPDDADRDDDATDISTDTDRATGPAPSDRVDLIVVANRLPFDLEPQPDGTTKARQAPGGLVTALEPILSHRHGAWIGWPGTADVELEATTTDDLVLHPLRLSAEEVDLYYEGFSNATLWPLYHDAVADSEYHREWWNAYERVNERFAERAAEVAAEGATVWVHDYQLQLVPQMLRRRRPDLRIGFFLHIPFPPAELFNRLPWRTQILAGLLGADLIGFQLPGGSRNFVRLARTLLGVPSNGGELQWEGRRIRAGAFPISIDSAAQSALAATPQVHAEARRLRSDLGNPRKIILGVDRLDYTKGIDIRLRAFGELLAEGDPAVQDTVLVQIATPSRERLQSYKAAREDIERTVGALNGDYGRIGRPAVHYLHQSLPRQELAAFYVAADVMAVTPLRDGMNLVAKEYVACRVDGGGVLLLSEFTGAARELKSALLVNPYDADGVKDALRTALTTSAVQARRRMRTLRRQVLTHDVDRWAAAFLSELEGTRDRLAEARDRIGPDALAAVMAISDTERLLVATDFDGTLAPIVDDPATARPLPETVEALRALAAIPGTTVAVVSGRALSDLREMVGDGPGVELIGSHGAETSEPGGRDDQLSGVAAQRLAKLRRVLQAITAEYPGIRLEPKPTGVAVHLRGADDADASAVTRAIEEDPATWSGVHLLRGKKVLELSVVATDKGRAVSELAHRHHCTGTVFIGDDITDENAFNALGPHDLGVKVGGGATSADVRIADPAHVGDLLRVLRHARGRGRSRHGVGDDAG